MKLGELLFERRHLGAHDEPSVLEDAGDGARNPAAKALALSLKVDERDGFYVDTRLRVWWACTLSCTSLSPAGVSM